MKRKPIDVSVIRFNYLKVGPVEVYDESRNGGGAKEQARDADTGHPIWKVKVRYRITADEFGQDDGDFEVKVVASAPPTFEEFELVTFDGLTASNWTLNGRSGETYWASGVRSLAEPLDNRSVRAAAAATGD